MAACAKRVIVLTGATGGGLGQALLKALLNSGGNDVVYAPVRDIGKAERLFPDAAGDRVVFLKMALDDPEGPARVVKEVQEKHGAVDVLINCAGMGRNWPLECETEATMMECMNVNCLGPIRLCQAVLPLMKAKKSGHIVNVTSIGGLVAGEMVELYAAAKFGLTGFSESLVLTARHFGINVTVVSPGPMNTPSLWSSVVKDYPRAGLDEKTQQLIDAKFPLLEGLKEMPDKIAQPDDAARMLLENTINSANPGLHYVMNFGYLQESLDSKFKDLDAYGQSQCVVPKSTS